MLLMCRLFAEDRVMPASMTGTRRRRRHMDLRERIRELPFFKFFFLFFSFRFVSFFLFQFLPYPVLFCPCF